MKHENDLSNTSREEGAEELATLIKLAGEDARARKRKAMAHHFKLIKEIVEA